MLFVFKKELKFISRTTTQKHFKTLPKCMRNECHSRRVARIFRGGGGGGGGGGGCVWALGGDGTNL